MVLSDDQSWPHAEAYGTDWVDTPHFNDLAREGALFNNAFVSVPSCAPSRASILAGRHFYQMEEGGVHGGFIPAKFPLYTHLLEDAGYRVGYTGKSCGPFWKNDSVGQQRAPYGQQFNQHRISREKDDIHSWNNIDYTANFREFLDQKRDRPFHLRLEARLDAKLLADGDPRALGNGEFFESTPSQFSCPVDPETGEPIFEDFPAPRKPVPGLRTFDHSGSGSQF